MFTLDPQGREAWLNSFTVPVDIIDIVRAGGILGPNSASLAAEITKAANHQNSVRTEDFFSLKEESRELTRRLRAVGLLVNNQRARKRLDGTAEILMFDLVRGYIAGCYGHIAKIYGGKKGIISDNQGDLFSLVKGGTDGALTLVNYQYAPGVPVPAASDEAMAAVYLIFRRLEALGFSFVNKSLAGYQKTIKQFLRFPLYFAIGEAAQARHHGRVMKSGQGMDEWAAGILGLDNLRLEEVGTASLASATESLTPVLDAVIERVTKMIDSYAALLSGEAAEMNFNSVNNLMKDSGSWGVAATGEIRLPNQFKYALRGVLGDLVVEKQRAPKRGKRMKQALNKPKRRAKRQATT